MKIRTRIISYVFVSCFIVIALFSSFVYFEMRELIMTSVNSNLSTVIAGVEEQMNSDEEDLPAILKHREYRGVYLLVSGPAGTFASDMAEKVQAPVSANKYHSAVITIDKDHKKLYRFERTKINVRGQEYEVTAGISMERIRDEMDDLFLNLLLATVGALLAVGFVGVMISNTILRPVKKIVDSAEMINSRNLSRRIEAPRTQDEISGLTATLNSLFDRLERSFNIQKEFIANISHEIKTPLTVLNLATDEALQSENLRSEETDYLIKINYNLNRINRLVKDIINLSYIETNQLDSLEDTDLRAMTEEILENLSEMTDDKKLSINVGGRGSVNGENRLIYSALMNLIHNAVKYTPEYGRIDILVKESNGRTEFSISNDCENIPDENLDRLFDRFYRVEKSRSREYGGAGLGLSIVKEIIAKHGGTVSVSKPEAGTIRFAFTI